MPYNAEQNQLDEQNKDPNVEAKGTQTSSSVNLAGSGGAPSAGNSGRVAAFSNGTPTQGSGSGRYTNLQKYLGSNEGATDRLYQGIGNRVEQTAQPKKQEAETEASKVKAGIEQGNQDVQRGTGYYNQLQDKNFNAQDFTSDQNRLNDYGQFRTGSTVDISGLNNQNSNAQQSNIQAQNVYNQRLGQVGNEGGRFDLLKETFGGRNAYKPTYSAGQQRLDQLFLQSGNGDKVGQLQNDIRGNVNTLGQGLSNLQGDVSNNISGLNTQQVNLAGNIQNKANNLETGYIGDIENQVGGVNTARDAERKRYGDFVGQILSSGRGQETSQQLDNQLFNEAQLRNGEQVFNAFKNPTLTTEQFQNIDKRNARTDGFGYQDIANQNNVDYYGSLAKLAGIDNSKLNQTGMLVDPVTGQLTRAATLKQGDGGLRNTINTAQDDFLKYAQGANITGHGEDTGTSGLFGSGGTAESNVNLNLNDYLKKQNQLPSEDGVIHADNNHLADANRMMFGGTDLGGFGNAVGYGTGEFASGLANTFGLSGNSGSSVAAAARARQNLLDNLTGTLKTQGYNNYLTTSGVKNADDIAQQSAGIESQRLGARNNNQYYTSNLNDQASQDKMQTQLAGQALTNLLAGKNVDRIGKDAFTNNDISNLQQQYANSVLDSKYQIDGKRVDQFTPEERAKANQDFLNSSMAPGTDWAGEGVGTGSINNFGKEAVQALLAKQNNAEATYNQQQAGNSAALRQRLGLSDINLNDFEGGVNDRVNTGGDIKDSPSMSLDELRRRFAGK